MPPSHRNLAIYSPAVKGNYEEQKKYQNRKKQNLFSIKEKEKHTLHKSIEGKIVRCMVFKKDITRTHSAKC